MAREPSSAEAWMIDLLKYEPLTESEIAHETNIALKVVGVQGLPQGSENARKFMEIMATRGFAEKKGNLWLLKTGTVARPKSLFD